MSASPSAYIAPNDPRFFQPETLPPPKYSGLVRCETGFTPRIDLPTPLTTDESALVAALLVLDRNPDDPRNSHRSKANSIVGCGRLVRRAECIHGDEARIYYVFCGQDTLCRRCGSGKARANKLRYTSPKLFSLIDSARCDVQTFSLYLGSPCQGAPTAQLDNLRACGPSDVIDFGARELAARLVAARALYNRLRLAIDREIEGESRYGAKVAYTVNPKLHSIEFRILWQDMPLPLQKIKKLFADVCSTLYTKILDKILESRGIMVFGESEWSHAMRRLTLDMEGFPNPANTSVTSQRFEVKSAAKALKLLLSGLEVLLMMPAEQRLRWIQDIFGKRLSSVCRTFRGAALEEATEEMWSEGDGNGDDSEVIPKHGMCSNHHEPLRMTAHAAATINEVEKRGFSKIYLGPMVIYRDKPEQETGNWHQAAHPPPS